MHYIYIYFAPLCSERNPANLFPGNTHQRNAQATGENMSSANQPSGSPTHNAITLEQLATLVAAELAEVTDLQDKAARQIALQRVGIHVSAACNDDGFVERHLGTRSAGQDVREVLYEDKDMGFCICGHVYADAAHGGAHDHGPSWAIYGQADGETEMSDWQVQETRTEPAAGKSSDSGPVKLVSKVDTYTLKRGDVHVYDIGDIHSPSRAQPVKLLRIEGENLDNIERSRIRPIDSEAS